MSGVDIVISILLGWGVGWTVGGIYNLINGRSFTGKPK